MIGGKVVVPLRVPEITPRTTDFAVQQTPTPRVPETQCDITVPTVVGFKARERSRVGFILWGGKASLDPRPPELALDANDPISRELIVAPGLTAGHAAAGVVVEGAEFLRKKSRFTFLSRARSDSHSEVVPVPSPAESAMGADIASGPGEQRHRRHHRRGLIDRSLAEIGGIGWCAGDKHDAGNASK